MSALGHPRVHLRRTDSTNDRARALAISGAPHGTLLTTSEQTAGHGRQGRHWFAPPNSSLLFSLVLNRERPSALLPLIAAVAVCDVVGSQAQIKWPNDIVFQDKEGLAKLGGILLEGRPQEGWVVLGIGLNVSVRLEELPPQVRGSAATLGLSPAHIEPLLHEMLQSLERRLSEAPDRVLADWRERDALYGREISSGHRRGCACGIDGEGKLLIRLPGGDLAALQAGEVHLQGGYSLA